VKLLNLLKKKELDSKKISFSEGEMDSEITCFLKKYLRINTSHPHPEYDKAIDLFVEQAKKDGFDYQIVDLPSQLKVLVASVDGSDKSLPSLVLNHHYDVVYLQEISPDGSIHPFLAARTVI
jgi:acetylornithine deacetylase/succinyl-diaminopimelate desuccinylase-like protein